jgi:hypothetical protein
MTECFRLTVSFCLKCNFNYYQNEKICPLRHLSLHSYIWLIWWTYHFVNIPELFIEVYIRTVNHAHFEEPKLPILNDIPASMTAIYYKII